MDDWKIALTLVVLGTIIPAITVFRIAPHMVLWGGLTVLFVVTPSDPVVTLDNALKGFANKGVFAVAALFIVADGLNQTGALNFLGQRLLGVPRSIKVAQLRTMVPCGLLSAYLNNTPVVALLMPIVSDWARKNRISVSHLLLPLSYSAILGGMCTLIGTSTTMVINDELPPAQQLGMYDIAWVGIPTLCVGMIYLIVCSKWLIPERRPAFTQLDDPREYTVEMQIESGSPLVGKTIEQAGLRHLPGMYLMEIDRAGHVMAVVPPNTVLESNDHLVFVGIVESILDLQKIPGLKPSTDQLFKLDGRRGDRVLVEAVVSSSCPYVRMSIRDANFRSNYNAVVIAVAREGARVRGKIGDIELCAGDTLLLECQSSFIAQQRNSRHFFLVSRVEGFEPTRHERAWIATLVMLAMIAVVSTGLLSMPLAAPVAAGLMVLTRCTRSSLALRAIDWSVILVMVGGLGIGEAMTSSGTAKFIASGLMTLAGQHPLVMLALISTLTMVLTNLITAKAAAMLVLPIAMSAAAVLNTSPMPFAVAVIMSAASSFATPIGYQTNQMVQGPGGYRSQDYIRLGGPLSVIVWCMTMIVVPIVWPF